MKKYLFLLLAFFLPLVARAEVPDFGLKITAQAAGLPTQTNDPITLVGKLISFVLGFLGIIFLILIIYSGWLYLTSGGNEEKISKAKRLISSSLIGLVIIALSYALAVYIFSNINAAVVTN